MPAYKDKKGTWFAKFQIKTYTGKSKQVLKRGFVKKADALAYEHDFKARYTYLPSITLETLSKAFLADYRVNHRPNSFKATEANLRLHILPIFGKFPIKEITAIKIREWQNNLKISELSPATQQSINTTFKAVMSYAVKYYHLPASPFLQAGAITREPRPQEVLSWEEWQKVSQTFKPGHDQTIFNLIYFSGIRLGEAQGLSISDFDFTAHTVRIERQYSYTTKKTEPLKTAKSHRLIALPAFVSDMVQKYLEGFYVTPSLPFALKTPRGLNFMLKKYCKLAGVPVVSVHALRHSHASLLIAKGMPITAVSARLGHTSSAITLRVYSHAFADADTKISGLLESLNKNVSTLYQEEKKSS